MQPAAALKRSAARRRLFFWLFAASLFFAACVQYGGMRITNLEWQTVPWKDSVPSAVQGFFSFGGMDIVSDDGARRHGTAPEKCRRILVKVFFSGLCILSELVLGSVGAAQLQAAQHACAPGRPVGISPL